MVSNREPLVSVLVPAYQCHNTIVSALRSVLEGTYGSVECVISPDDGDDYSYLAKMLPEREGYSLRVLPPSMKRSGPGPARNRALMASTGELIALLDADDEWGADYLAGLVPPAMEHGIAFGCTHYIDELDRLVRVLPASPMPQITLDVCSRLYGNLHAVVKREYCRPFSTLHAEDVLHDLSCLAAAGGTAPLVYESIYRLRLHQNSSTSLQPEHSFQDAYRQLIHLILESPDALHLHEFSIHTRKQIAEPFRGYLNASLLYGQERGTGESYHSFIMRSPALSPL